MSYKILQNSFVTCLTLLNDKILFTFANFKGSNAPISYRYYKINQSPKIKRAQDMILLLVLGYPNHLLNPISKTHFEINNGLEDFDPMK